jgi:hypothetical protein
MEPGIYPNISHDAYHKMTEVVSNSYLGRLNHCPASANIPMAETPALTFGRAFHSFILDGVKSFQRDFAVSPGIDKRTKEGKAAYALFCEESGDKTVISQDDMDSIEEMYGAIVTHPIAAKLLMEGRSEMSVFWTDEKTGLPCKCRPDRIPDGDHGVILDLKSVRSAEIHAFTSACMTYGYAREAGMYIEGFNTVSSAKVDAFVFICVEKEPPYRIEVYTLEDLFIEYGKKEFRRLINIEKECRDNDFWPHWKNEEIKTLYLPNYAGGDL